ncbi:NUDIX hydrolase [Streptomyces sp. NPDC050560]|uniref:NUDIX hydrolase n=1 Tax=Streptomyces sp. NPDC050560 TaxID=3365630 RepID=UPI00378A4AB0
MSDRITHRDPAETRCSVAVFRDSSLLLLQSEEDGRPVWKLPGGHVRTDEGLIACARRELREETGLEAGALHCALVLDIHDRPNGRHIVEIVLYPTGGVPGTPQPLERAHRPRFVPMASLDGLPLRPPIQGRLHDLRHVHERELNGQAPSPGAGLYSLP